MAPIHEALLVSIVYISVDLLLSDVNNNSTLAFAGEVCEEY